MNTIQQIRENERLSHMEQYANMPLYESGGWLSKPIKTVLEVLPMLEDHTAIRCLDLGCGIGRNCIAVAQYFQKISCTIDCVDLLDLAIKKLRENAEKFGVSRCIHGIVQTIEDFLIPPDTYDLVLAVSALEHLGSKEHFTRKMGEICDGIRPNGIVCLVINSDVTETDAATGVVLVPQFEVNLTTGELLELLRTCFGQWSVIKETVVHQRYSIPRGNTMSDLNTNVVTLVARK